MITRDFITAGRAIFTLQVSSKFAADHPEVKPSYTYRVTHKDASDRWPEAWFVSLLTGPDNLSDYQPIGKLDPASGSVRLTRNSQYTDETWPVRLVRRVLAAIWQGREAQIEVSGFMVYHEGRCGRCGRVLTVPSSIRTGLGPECAGRSRIGGAA